MVNRARAKKIRVSVLLSSPTPSSAATRQCPVVSSLPVIGSTSGFDPRCPHFFEEDVVVIDHSVQPSTSGRSVEVARNALTSSMRYSEKNKRNRLFDPLASISSRLQRQEQEDLGRLRFPKNELESKKTPKASAIKTPEVSPIITKEPQKQSKPKEDRAVVICERSEAPIICSRKPILYGSCDSRPSSSSHKSVSEKSLDIVIRRDFKDLRVVNSSKRKRVAAPIERREQDPSSPPHIHKSETLTVIIPKRRSVVAKQNTDSLRSTLIQRENTVPSNNVPTTSSMKDVTTDGEVKCLEENVPTTFSSLTEVQNGQKEDDYPETPVSNGGVVQDVAKVDANQEEEKSTSEVVEEDCLVSDDDSEDVEDEAFLDPPVFKSTISDDTIIPFFSDKYVFSNHYPCRRLFIHGQRFSSTEQFYMWTKARFCKDFSAANAILYLNDPKMIKQVGSQLENFDQHRWRKFSWRVMMKAVMAKFKQDRNMRFQLFRTAGSMLTEANPHDNYWGIGLAIDDPNVANPSRWKGCNVMGEILMQIRDVLLENPKYSAEVKNAKQHLLGCV
ncbi:hypothetical protein RB195_009719 [Necator americanus]